MMFWQTKTSGRHAASPQPGPRHRLGSDATRFGTAAGHAQDRVALRGLLRWFRTAPDDGMSTAEYAIGTIAAAAFAAVLYAVVTGDSIVSGLTSLVQHALTVSF